MIYSVYSSLITIMYTTRFNTAKRTFLNVLFYALIMMLSGCSLFGGKKIDFSRDITEQGLYTEAQRDIKRNELADAIEKLQLMEKLYPFGEYSISAQLSLIYAQYAFKELASASAAANRFVRLHPNHRHVDYAYYMKGLIEFPQAATYLQRAFDVDLSKRDVGLANASFNHFSTLVNRFPKSEYAPDAIKRMEFLRNLLARHEIHVANYYLERKAYLAAANRGRYVIENFQTTPAVPDALAVMAQGYYKMNMLELVENSIKVLRENYPDYPAFKEDGSFDFEYSTRIASSIINFASLGVFGSSKPPGFNTEDLYNR